MSSADRRFAPTRPSRGGPHGVPSDARVTRTLREPGERAGESPLLHGLTLSSSTARAAPSPQRERRTAPPSTSARQVPTCARRSVVPSLRCLDRALDPRAASLRARARGAFVAEEELRLHGGGVSGWSTPRPRRRGRATPRTKARSRRPGRVVRCGSGRRSARRTRHGACPAASLDPAQVIGSAARLPPGLPVGPLALRPHVAVGLPLSLDPRSAQLYYEVAFEANRSGAVLLVDPDKIL